MFMIVGFRFANCQDKGDWKVSSGVLYGTETKTLGFNIGTELLFSDFISGNISYANYLNDVNHDFKSLSFQTRFYFHTELTYRWYAMAGYRFGATSRGRKTAPEIGAGFYYPLGKRLGVQVQTSYDFNILEQFEFQGGMNFRLN